jgi:hypothetical protein
MIKHITREDMIKAGQIIPTEKEYKYYDRPDLTKEIVDGIRARLIKHGFIKPSLRH